MFLNLASNDSRKTLSSSILMRKKKGGYQQYENCYSWCWKWWNWAYAAKSGKESNMDQVHDIYTRVYEISTNDKKMVCVTVRMYSVNDKNN